VTATHDEPVVPAPNVEPDVFLDDQMEAPADSEDIVAWGIFEWSERPIRVDPVYGSRCL